MSNLQDRLNEVFTVIEAENGKGKPGSRAIVEAVALGRALLATQDKQVIHISGRRWFEPVNGNTYHSVRIWVDGVSVGGVDFASGYGDGYIQTGMTWLEENGYMSGREHYNNGFRESHWQYAARTGTKITVDVVDVKRKKDL
jgi:hypothetical protein